ncbi:hypothetical protein [Thiohalocapsa sp. ML1]|jgi:hypothetical protein|uniref:hypothetical protein n=1 Tax=Thiohalocapsa sp. ML1 TaxID=1431688 RepID=UPI00073240A0|nr:hypothetical protein [Thiohalocapsa sp. ML1]
MAPNEMRVDVHESVDQVLIAGRDIHQTHQTFFDRAPDFVTPSLDRYRPSVYIGPRIVGKLLRSLQAERLILLTGEPEVDKAELARYLTWTLINKVAHGKTLAVKEWLRGSESRSLVSAIRNEADPTVFLLIDLQPQDANWDLDRLFQVADGKHFIIATMDGSLRKWDLPAHAESAWARQLSAEDVYDQEFLSRLLREEVIRRRAEMPAPFDSVSGQDDPLVGGSSIRDIAARLRSPGQVATFVNTLRAETGPLDAARVDALLEIAADPARTIDQAFRSLDSGGQPLAAIGFSFFEGLLDDQAFRAVERLYQEAWKERNPTLTVPDYCDLAALEGNLFEFVSIERNSRLVQGRVAEQRSLLMQAAWYSRRRQILAAMPVLVKMVSESVSDDGATTDRELLGDQDRRRRLRDAVADSLSDVGLVSPEAVENELLKLAAHPSAGARAVAARAMARWRQYDKHDQLFARLEAWQQDAYARRFIRALFQQQQRQTSNPEDYLRATIALTVGYAGRYDPANRLAKNLLDRVEEFADDSAPVVREAFGSWTLPLLVPLHAQLLKDTLKGMTRHLELTGAIARSLAIAYRADPVGSLAILDEWFTEASAMKPTRTRFQAPGDREKLLLTVVFAYGLLDPESGDQADIDDRLEEVLRAEKHPVVRVGLVAALAAIGGRDFDRFSATLRRVVDNVREDELGFIRGALREMFKTERRALEGGDAWLQHDGIRYPIWVDSLRPLTNIERTLLGWLTDADATALTQQLALQSWVMFESLLHDAEKQRIQEIKDAREKEKEAAGDEEPDLASTPLKVRTRFSFVPFLVTLNRLQYKRVIKALYAVAAGYGSSNKSLMAVLDRWSDPTDKEIADPDIERIALLLKRALDANAWVVFWLILAAGATLSGILWLT